MWWPFLTRGVQSDSMRPVVLIEIKYLSNVDDHIVILPVKDHLIRFQCGVVFGIEPLTRIYQASSSSKYPTL